MAVTQKQAFDETHAALKKILAKYEGKGLEANPNKPGHYVLTGPRTETSWGKDIWFGGVRTGKSYVSFHLIAVYVFPDLLEKVSPDLKKRMQGKSCFNFTKPDPALLKEVAKLTEAGYKRYRAEKLIL
jgi:hypothetical protein